MKIQHFSQQGKRSNNEDSFGISAGLLTVCDGMGGHNYGERASAFVKDALVQAFAEPKPLGMMEIQQQLNQVQYDLNKLLDSEPELEKMGTTFTGVFITPDLWYAAHIGDSRIYLFRPSERKLWHTWDHSIVGELMRTHEITMEAGRFHPMSNRISRAIMAQKDGKPANASIVKIEELKKGDIFLLCSDGVVEGWGDLELVKLFSDANLSFEQKCEKLRMQCEEKSRDNNTAIIAEIEEKDAYNYSSDESLEWTSFEEVEADYQKYLKDSEVDANPTESNPSVELDAPVDFPAENPATKSSSGFNWRKVLPLLLLLIALVILGFVFLNRSKTVDNQPLIEQPVTDSIQEVQIDRPSKEQEESKDKVEQPQIKPRSQEADKDKDRPDTREVLQESMQPADSQSSALPEKKKTIAEPPVTIHHQTSGEQPK